MKAPREQLTGKANSWLASLGALVLTGLLFGLVILGQQNTEFEPPEPEPELVEFFVPPPPPPPQREEVEPLPDVTPITMEIPKMAPTTEMKLDFLDVDFEIGMDTTIVVDLNVDSYRRSELDNPFAQPGIFENKEVDEKPERLYTPTSRVPNEFRGSKMRLHVMYVVTEKGRADKIFVMDSTDEALNKWIIENIKRWRFKPAYKGNRRVKVWVEHAFILNQSRNLSPFAL